MPKYRGRRFVPSRRRRTRQARLYTGKYGRDIFYLKLPNRKTWYPVDAAEILSLSTLSNLAREIRRRGNEPSLHR